MTDMRRIRSDTFFLCLKSNVWMYPSITYRRIESKAEKKYFTEDILRHTHIKSNQREPKYI